MQALLKIADAFFEKRKHFTFKTFPFKKVAFPLKKNDSIFELTRNVAHSRKYHLRKLTSHSFSLTKKLV